MLLFCGGFNRGGYQRRLQRRGMDLDWRCLLCGQEIESIEHLFYKCGYTRSILLKAYEMAGRLYDLALDTNFTSMVNLLNKTIVGSKAWGLSWTLLGIILWCVWKEHNGGWKKGVCHTKEDILRDVINTVDTRFKSS